MISTERWNPVADLLSVHQGYSHAARLFGS